MYMYVSNDTVTSYSIANQVLHTCTKSHLVLEDERASCKNKLINCNLIRVRVKDTLNNLKQGCCLTGAQQPGACKKMIWVHKVFAAAPNTLPVGLLTSRLLPFWAP